MWPLPFVASWTSYRNADQGIGTTFGATRYLHRKISDAVLLVVVPLSCCRTRGVVVVSTCYRQGVPSVLSIQHLVAACTVELALYT